MHERACVFVDGENLRHSLIDAFVDESIFQRNEYLPSAAEWASFFDWVVREATGGTHRRLRAYWFVIQDLDFFPYGMNQLSRTEHRHRLKRILCKYQPFQERLQALNGDRLATEMEAIVDQLRATQRRIESRFKGWISLQNGIALKHRAIEFRRAGAITFNLCEQKFGQEKAVDVRLACDMLVLQNIYDTAIIVSGDQDYVPAAQILKDSGKTVINVSFEKRDGELLPGGARRLNIATDSSIRVPYLKLRSFMGLETPVATSNNSWRRANWMQKRSRFNCQRLLTRDAYLHAA